MLKSLREIASLVNATSDLDAVFEQIVFALAHHTTWSTCGIMGVNRASGFSELVARCAGEAIPQGLPTRWKLDTSPSLVVADTRRPIVIPDAQRCEEYPGYKADAIARGYHTVVLLPLNVTDLTGRDLVLAVHAREPIEVGDEELDFLLTVTHLAAIAVNKATSIREERVLAGRLERILDVSSGLFERVIDGASLPTLAGMIESALAHPLVVVDLVEDTVYARRSPTPSLGDRAWAEFARGCLLHAFRSMLQESEASSLDGFRRLELPSRSGPLALDVLVETLRVEGETVGGILLFPRHALDKVDRLALQEAKLALGVRMLRSVLGQRRASFELPVFLECLIDGRIRDEDSIKARAARAGLTFAPPLQLFVFDGPHEGGESPSLVQEAALERIVTRIWRNAASAPVHGRHVVLVPVADADSGKEAFAKAVADMSRSLKAGSRVIEGPVLSGLRELPAAYRTCRRLLTLARMFGKTGLVRARSLGPLAVLVSACDTEAVPTFVAETIGRIKAHDARHGTALLATAAAFADAGCRFQATADALGIHISTLRHRLGRLHDLFSLDLTDPETRFSIALALRLEAIGSEALGAAIESKDVEVVGSSGSAEAGRDRHG